MGSCPLAAITDYQKTASGHQLQPGKQHHQCIEETDLLGGWAGGPDLVFETWNASSGQWVEV
jgi:hypothetical protein